MRGLLAFGLGLFGLALCSCATTEPVGVTHTTSAVVVRREVRRAVPFPISRSDAAYFRLAGRTDLGVRQVDSAVRSSAPVPPETSHAMPRTTAVHAAAPAVKLREPPPPPAHHGPPNA